MFLKYSSVLEGYSNVLPTGLSTTSN